MSYDLMIWAGKHPTTEDEVVELIGWHMDQYLAETMLEPHPRIVELANRLASIWPDDVDDEDGSSSPWSTYPLLSDASGPFIQISVQWFRAEEAAPVVAGVARDLGLVCVDPSGFVYSETSGLSPSIAQVRAQLPELFPASDLPRDGEPPKNGGFFDRFRRNRR